MKEGYDVVVASRYYQGIKSEDDDMITAFGNWMFTTMINVFHGGSYLLQVLRELYYWKGLKIPVTNWIKHSTSWFFKWTFRWHAARIRGQCFFLPDETRHDTPWTANAAPHQLAVS